MVGEAQLEGGELEAVGHIMVIDRKQRASRAEPEPEVGRSLKGPL